MSQTLTGTSWRRVREIVKSRDKEVCQYCGKHSPNGEADHVLPLSQGGHDGLDSLVWCCKDCNINKKDKTLREWVKELTGRGKFILPAIKHEVDRGAAGWSCDCGGYSYEEESRIVHNANYHGHHKPDCPILYLNIVYHYSPYCSKIVDGELILGQGVLDLLGAETKEYCAFWDGEALEEAKTELQRILLERTANSQGAEG